MGVSQGRRLPVGCIIGAVKSILRITLEFHEIQ